MIMVKFKFQLNAGFFVRNQVRIELRRSKEKLEYVYSDSSLSIREEKNWFDSTFYVQGTDFPDDSFDVLEKWVKKIKANC